MSSTPNNVRRQGRYWLLTLSKNSWTPHLPEICNYIKGQAETGDETGYEHWQVLCVTKRKTSLTAIKRGLGALDDGRGIHGELSRSDAANEYVWKEATRIEGTQFEFGVKTD